MKKKTDNKKKAKSEKEPARKQWWLSVRKHRKLRNKTAEKKARVSFLQTKN